MGPESAVRSRKTPAEPLSSARGVEAAHHLLLLSGGLVGVLDPVVQILRATVLDPRHQSPVRYAVAGQLVGDQHPGHIPQSLQQLAEEPGRGPGVTSGGDQNVQHRPVLVHRPPQIMGLAIDLDEDIVDVPFIPWSATPAAQSMGVELAELAAPLMDGLVGDCRQQGTVTVLTAHTGPAAAIRSVAIRRGTTMPRMPQPAEDDQNSSPEKVILGMDTHKDLHVAAVLTALGALRETKTFPATAAGYQALLAWVGTFGILRRAGVECTGSYGAALARSLRAAEVEVIEVNQPDKATRRQRGKTDTLDAQAAARAVLSGRASATAKAGDGPVEMLRMFKLVKTSAIKARTQTINQLKAVLVAADPQLRETL